MSHEMFIAVSLIFGFLSCSSVSSDTSKENNNGDPNQRTNTSDEKTTEFTETAVTQVEQLGNASQTEPEEDSQGTFTKCKPAEVDLLLVIDSSGSSEKFLEDYKRIASELIDSIPIGSDATLVSLVQYSNYAIVRLWFDDHQTAEDIIRLIRNLELKGGVTETGDAVTLAIQQFRYARRQRSKRLFLIFTDGNSNDPWPKAEAASAALHSANARVIIYADGDPLGENELELYVGSNGTLVRRGEQDRLYDEVRKFAFHC